jgi:hypothetical protein
MPEVDSSDISSGEGGIRHRPRQGNTIPLWGPAGAFKKAPMWTRLYSGGEGGIRTLGSHKDYSGFRDRPVQPLRHLSKVGQAVYYKTEF